jgi:hypothetical protein
LVEPIADPFRAVDDDRAARLLQFQVVDPKRQRLGDPQPAPDEQLGQRAVNIRAGVQITRNLVEP